MRPCCQACGCPTDYDDVLRVARADAQAQLVRALALQEVLDGIQARSERADFETHVRTALRTVGAPA